jgi:hypothetical protein
MKIQYDDLSEFEKRRYDRDWKRDIAIELKEFLKAQKIFGLTSKKNIEKQFHAQRKDKEAKQLALPAPHGHAHPHAHAADNMRGRPLTGIDNLDVDDDPPPPLKSQFSYDNALWGAQTHTRARDSLRYLLLSFPRRAPLISF